MSSEITFKFMNQKLSNILVVDDTPDNLLLIVDVLKDFYHVRAVNSGEKALRIANSPQPPDLILLDVMMPELNGYEVCKRLKSNPGTSEIPVIFITALSEMEDEKHGFELGAVDYILKPISSPILLARVKTHIHLKKYSDFLQNQNQILESEVESRIQEIRNIQEVTILALAALAETRDNDTGNHLRRTQIYIKLLATALKDHPRFKDFLSENNITLLYKSAPLHDIGKVGIPDRILLKPGRLDTDEFEIMKTHCKLGYDALDYAERSIGIKIDFLQIAKDIVLYHHEKWDGTGYPLGLKNDEIPIPARLMAIADVYDALTATRVYKASFPHEDARSIILEGKGNHFDPDIVDAFLGIHSDFLETSKMYSDRTY
ncbi:MAG: two-component system response regulator [Leptospiraceae bacterium]|nr:two-component system response regulator [Leptospiraceae bacterium]